MEYYYSDPLDQSSHQSSLVGDAPVRQHRCRDVERQGYLSAQKDWEKHVGSCRGYKGCDAPRFGYTSLMLPECRPELVELLSYTLEICLLLDDFSDSHHSERTQDVEEVDKILGLIHPSKSDSNASAKSKSSKQELLFGLAKRFLAIDKENTLPMLKTWKDWLEKSGGRGQTEYSSLNDYLQYRLCDSGAEVWHFCIVIAMGLHLPISESAIADEAKRLGVAGMVLGNDYYSYEKEVLEAKRAGRGAPVNAVALMMELHGEDADQALSRCKLEATQAIRRCVDWVHELALKQEVSLETKAYARAWMLVATGSAVWSKYAPRYHDFEDVLTPPHSGQQTPETSSDAYPEMNQAQLVLTIVADVSADLDRRQIEAVQQPYDYTSSMPSKNVRGHILDALNQWIGAPDTHLTVIKSIIDRLHGASLMLDDFQDSSPLRRGQPAAHTIYGAGPTVNSAQYQILEAASMLQRLEAGQVCMSIFLDEMKALHLGQGLDLSWTFHTQSPSIDDYLYVCDRKTGGLFRLAVRLLQTGSNVDVDVSTFVSLLGRLYQVRDDYMNLTSKEMLEKKGWCEDLDEGKFSLPIVHALGLSHKPAAQVTIRSLLAQRRCNGHMPTEHKKLMLRLLVECGSLDFTLVCVRQLHDKVISELAKLEAKIEEENLCLRLLVDALRI